MAMNNRIFDKIRYRKFSGAMLSGFALVESLKHSDAKVAESRP